MTRQYLIGGISCQNCIDKITANLLKHPSITKAVVDLESKIATIEMESKIPLLQLQKYISSDGTYFIRMEIT